MSLRVAVTGATGFVGSSVVKWLRAKGWDVVPVVRSGRVGANVGFREVLQWNSPTLEAALEGTQVAVHAASVVHRPGASLREYEEFNVEGTKILLAAAKTAGVRQIVFLSTIKVYGEEPTGPIDESTAVDRSSPYASSKLEAERILTEGATGGLTTTIFRLAPVFGPGDKGNVRRVAIAIARRRFAVPGDGHTRKSIVHISTVANAIARVIEAERGGLYVLADPVAPSMRELADVVATALHRRRLPSIPVPLLMTAAAGIELAARFRRREPNVSRELIRKSLRSTICSPALFERTFGMSCHVELKPAIEEEVRWLRSEGLL